MLKKTYYPELDSLRGLAACSVVFCHFATMTPMHWATHLPFYFLALGHQSVILFFVLSGFVLTLQLQERGTSYAEYMIKRIFRIYVPYLAIQAIALMCLAFSYKGAVSWAGDYFNSTWIGWPSNSALFSHILLIAPFSAYSIDPVVWSLIYEMRISLIFPLVVYLVKALPSAYFGILLCCSTVLAILWLESPQFGPIQTGYQGGWIFTMHYLAMFMAGSLLAKTQASWRRWLDSRTCEAIVFLIAVCAYFCSEHFADLLFTGTFREAVEDWGTMIGSLGIIAVSLHSAFLAKQLKASHLLYLGNISYSLYLTHWVVILTTAHTLNHPRDAGWALALSAALTLPVAIAAHHLIELPSVELGKRLIYRLSRQRVAL